MNPSTEPNTPDELLAAFNTRLIEVLSDQPDYEVLVGQLAMRVRMLIDDSMEYAARVTAESYERTIIPMEREAAARAMVKGIRMMLESNTIIQNAGDRKRTRQAITQYGDLGPDALQSDN